MKGGEEMTTKKIEPLADGSKGNVSQVNYITKQKAVISFCKKYVKQTNHKEIIVKDNEFIFFMPYGFVRGRDVFDSSVPLGWDRHYDLPGALTTVEELFGRIINCTTTINTVQLLNLLLPLTKTDVKHIKMKFDGGRLLVTQNGTQDGNFVDCSLLYPSIVPKSIEFCVNLKDFINALRLLKPFGDTITIDKQDRALVILADGIEVMTMTEEER